MIKRKETTAELIARLVLAYWKRKEQEQLDQQQQIDLILEVDRTGQIHRKAVVEFNKAA